MITIVQQNRRDIWGREFMSKNLGLPTIPISLKLIVCLIHVDYRVLTSAAPTHGCRAGTHFVSSTIEKCSGSEKRAIMVAIALACKRKVIG